MQQKVTNTRTQRDDHTGLLETIRHKYQPYWPLFVIASVFAVIAAYIYLRYATPIYKISATLLIKEDAKAVEKSIIELMDPLGSGKKVDNEIEILRSRTMAKAVIRNLNLYGEIFERGRLRDVSVYNNGPVRVNFLDPDSIGAMESSVVDLKYDAEQKKVTLADKVYALNDTVSTRWGRIVINPVAGFNPASMKNKLFYLRVTGEKALALQFLGNLKVMPTNKQANVLRLEYINTVPERGQDMLNELMRAYDAASIDDKNKTASKTMAFVEDRLRIITGELNQVEGEIEKYKTDQNIVDISEQSKMFLEAVRDNDSKLSDAELQLSMLDAIEKYVTGRKADEKLVPATLGISDPVLLELVGDLQTTEMQLERLKKTTGENSPLLTSLTDQAEKLRPAILQNIRSLRANLQAGKDKLSSQNARFMGMLKGVPGKERTLLEVSRQQVIKNNIYTFLLEKREETALQYAAAISDSRIIDIAEADTYPFSPKKSMVMALAVIAGLASVAGFIALKDMMNHKVMFRADIEKGTSAPIIGEIMFEANGGGIAITDGKRTPVAEQFRALRTTLSYIGINGDHKTIMVTSSISGEGKSFVAINLAISLSLTKKKVVILEFDLRKPKVSKILNVPHHPGISNYLVGQAVLGDILKKPIEGNEYLHLLSAGIIPPNPTELILNGRLEHLLATLRATFDYIIIDTAPVAPVTDARLLAPFADATIYVVRHERTPKFHLKMIEELYEQGDLGKLNIVFNGLKMRGVPGYGYAYGNGYGYGNGQGYGYGYTEEHKNGSAKKGRFTKIFNKE